mgnify:CR=1 FL=1
MSTVMNVVGDVVLAGQCGASWLRLREQGAGARAWSSFFGSMTWGFAAGGLRHAIPYDGPAGLGVLVCVNLAVGAGVIAAQSATLAWLPRQIRRRLRDAFLIQLGAFGALSLWRHDFMPAFVNLVIGFGWVLVTAIAAGQRGREGAASITRGLGLGVVSGVVYLVGRGPAEWFDHVDVAHILIAGALLLLYRGARREAAPVDPAPQPGRAPRIWARGGFLSGEIE